MREGYRLKLLRIPVRILFFGVLEVLPQFYVVIEVLKRMLEAVIEDRGGPIVGPSLVPVDDVNEDPQFGFIGVVFEDLYDFSLGDVLVLYGESAFYMFVHFFGHEVESLDLRD